MDKSTSPSNHGHSIKRERFISKTSTQKQIMGKYFITKRRHSHQSKILRNKQEETLIVKTIEHANSTIRFKHRTASTFRPLAASTPYDIEQSNAFNDGSPHSCLKSERVFFIPPVFSSTPKPIRHSTILNSTSRVRSSTSCKQKHILDSHPPVPIISPRRLQFTPNTKSAVRYSNDDSKRLNIQNVKIWLL